MEVFVTSKRYIFLYSTGGRFEIGPDAIEVMHSYIQDAPNKIEAGGVLLGRHLLGSADIIVDRVTAPMRGDRGTRYRFRRARRRHQAEIDRVWRESNGTCAYLGEWHTHPVQQSNPSPIDLQDWDRKLRNDQFTQPIFFVIVGTHSVGVWEGWKIGTVIQTTLLTGEASV
jgi:integrative and conjugative element protein (TIGR02256 family)